MLLSTSLAKQPDLRATLKSCEHQLHYICGKKDRNSLNWRRVAALNVVRSITLGIMSILNSLNYFRI